MTYFGVARFRSWTLKRGVLDHPNERSSHDTPTPRGGGLVLAIVVMAAYIIGSYLLGYDISVGFAVGALLIVLISWLDDVYTISFAWRLLVHSAAAVLVIYSCDYVTSIPTPFSSQPIEFGWFGAVITFGWIVWLVNAYNFMDGIDGIAGIKATAAAIGWILLNAASDVPSVYILSGTVLFASLAFLLHNWPPARIFMGDAGSAFLGFVFASLPLIAGRNDANRSGILLLAAISFVWLFVFDSAFTLIRRAMLRHKVWHAHREHLYQRLVRSGMSHRSTTLLYGVISMAVAVSTSLLINSGNPRSVAIISMLLAASAAVVVVVCWRRNCLFGDVA